LNKTSEDNAARTAGQNGPLTQGRFQCLRPRWNPLQSTCIHLISKKPSHWGTGDPVEGGYQWRPSIAQPSKLTSQAIPRLKQNLSSTEIESEGEWRIARWAAGSPRTAFVHNAANLGSRGRGKRRSRPANSTGRPRARKPRVGRGTCPPGIGCSRR
jgi:hypothetical protein